jgi:hypothetical protein
VIQVLTFRMAGQGVHFRLLEWLGRAVFLDNGCFFWYNSRNNSEKKTTLKGGFQPRNFSMNTSQTSAFTPREVELLDGMIEVQLHHAAQCDGMKNRSMADKQKGWDMERVQLLQKIKAAQVAQAQAPWGFHINFNNGRSAMFEGVDKLAECEAFLESDEEITLLFTTAGQVVVPEGYKLVPVNPTCEMLAAADEGDREYTKRNFGDIQTVMQGPEDHYLAMIAAAPALSVQAVPAASPVQQALLPAGLPTPDELEALSDGNDGMLLNAPFLYKLDLLASWMRKYTTAAQPAPAMQEPVDEYGSTDFGFEIAGVAVTDGDKRLLALLTNAFGNDHPAFDDLTALVLTARSKATPPAEPAPCTWSQSTDPSMPDTFAATCGVVWTFTEGGPRENGMHFCPGCGAKVAQGASS